MDCNHIIGVGGASIDECGFLHESERIPTIAMCTRINETWAANPHAVPWVAAHVLTLRGDDILRKDYTLFRFCPECGTEIVSPIT